LIKAVLLLTLFFFEAEAFMIENSYNNAHQKTLHSHKILMVYLTKKKCDYCNRELMKIINSKNISSFIEKNAVFVIVYKEQKNTFPIEMLYTTEYPTLFFLDKYENYSCEALRKNINLQAVKSCLKTIK
jgi:thioredoxin-related protein